MATGKIKTGKSKVIRLNYDFLTGQNVTGKYIIEVIDKDDIVREIDETNNYSLWTDSITYRVPIIDSDLISLAKSEKKSKNWDSR